MTANYKSQRSWCHKGQTVGGTDGVRGAVGEVNVAGGEFEVATTARVAGWAAARPASPGMPFSAVKSSISAAPPGSGRVLAHKLL